MQLDQTTLEDGTNQTWSAQERPRFRAFTTRFRLLPTFMTAFFTADADFLVFFAVYRTS